MVDIRFHFSTGWKGFKVENSLPIPPNRKHNLHQEKVMLSIWWDWKGILYFKPFPPSRKMKSYVYHEQLDKLKKEIEKKKKTPRIDLLEGRRLPPRQRTTS